MNSGISEGGGSLLALSDELARAVEHASRAVVTIYARERTPSSGIHWSKGTVVTAAHTIRRKENIGLKLPDGQRIAASLAGVDFATDLAVLKIETTEMPSAELGESTALKPGYLVLGVGRRGDLGLKVNLGVVSSIGGSGGVVQVDQYIQVDLPRYPGFSGSALVDVQGRIVGVNTSGLSRRLTLALPNSTVECIARVLLEKGRVPRGFLGLGMHPIRLPETLKNRLNLAAEGGVIVFQVESNGPADQGGILIGDILIAFDGKPIQGPEEVQAALTLESVGKTVTASVVRGGVLAESTITIGERPGRR